MIKKTAHIITQKIQKKLNLSGSMQEFLQSSSIVFSANIFGAMLGYILVIIVSRELENISVWTALNSFVMIVGIIIAGLETEISRRSAVFYKESLLKSFYYFFSLKKDLKKSIPFFLLLSPVFAFLIQNALGTEFLLIFIVLLNIPAQLFLQSQLGFLVGVFQNNDFSKSVFILNVSRFVSTLLFLFLGFEVYSLVLGIFVSTLVGWAYTFFLIKNLHPTDKKKYMVSQDSRSKSFYSLSTEINNIASTVFANTAIYLSFFLLPLLSLIFLSPENSDIFAILFTIGQMIHLGISSFLILVVPFAAGKDDARIFWFSLFFTGFGGVCGVLFFVYFREIVFSIFSRAEYSEYVTEMTIYFCSVALFNILFFLGRYLIGKGFQKRLFWLFGILGAWLCLLFFLLEKSSGYLELDVFLWCILGLMISLLTPLLRGSR